MVAATKAPNNLPSTDAPKPVVLTTPPTAPSGFDDFLDQYSALRERADAESVAANRAQAGAIRRGIAKQREIASRMPEAPKAPTDFVAPPSAPNRPVGDPFNVFKTYAPALAILASFKARRPLVSSMNALASAMEGYQKGDLDVYNRERQIWQDNLDTALEQNKQMIDRYDLIRTQYDDDMARMEVELKLAAKEMNDEKTIAALSAPGGAKQALQRLVDLKKLQTELEKARGGNRPITAAESLANQIQEARASGDTQRVRDLYTAGKLLEKGQTIDENGNVVNMPGFIGSSQESASSEAFSKKIGAESGSELFAKKESAENALRTINANNRALEILDSGIVSGFGADYIVGFGKALRQAGFDFGGDDISNTETFMVTRAQAVASIVKEFGSGVSISNADREYAEKAAAGKISLEKESLERILRISNDVSRQAVSSYERLLSKAPSSAMPIDLSVRSAPPDYRPKETKSEIKILGFE